MAVYVRFVALDSDETLPRWQVESTSDQSVLGHVAWFPRWRRFVFFPMTGTAFDAACLREIARFCDKAKSGRPVLDVATGKRSERAQRATTERIAKLKGIGIVLLALLIGFGCVGCSEGTPVVWTVNYSCAGDRTVGTVDVMTDGYHMARYLAVAKVERLCGIGLGAYVVGSAEAKREALGVE